MQHKKPCRCFAPHGPAPLSRASQPCAIGQQARLRQARASQKPRQGRPGLTGEATRAATTGRTRLPMQFLCSQPAPGEASCRTKHAAAIDTRHEQTKGMFIISGVNGTIGTIQQPTIHIVMAFLPSVKGKRTHFLATITKRLYVDEIQSFPCSCARFATSLVSRLVRYTTKR